MASYSQHRDDVYCYPYHKAYIWEKSFGVDKLSLKVGAGAFIGTTCGTSSQKCLKDFIKDAATVKVFGRSFSIAKVEYSDHTSGDTFYH